MPWIEFIGAIVLFAVLPNYITPKTVLEWFLVVGLVSLFLMSFVSKVLNDLFNVALNKGITITIVTIHIIGIIIACS